MTWADRVLLGFTIVLLVGTVVLVEFGDFPRVPSRVPCERLYRLARTPGDSLEIALQRRDCPL